MQIITDTPDEIREYVQEMEEDGSCGMLTEIKKDGADVRYSYDEKSMLTEEPGPVREYDCV